jgi:hypothetical protein
MTYPYVPAFHDLGPARGPRLAITWHHAEGGGTVGFLSRENPNGVAVHFVIEYSGRIVQMLPLDHMQASIRATEIRTTDDAPYTWGGVPVTYGATAARAVLGDWARVGSTLGPNHASIGAEIEGFAKDGPNSAQADAMARLSADMGNRYPEIRSLAHRDFADYKVCPGHKIPWDRVGGHGPEVPDMVPLVITSTTPKVVSLPAGAQLVNPDGTALVKVSLAQKAASPYEAKVGTAIHRVISINTGGTPKLALVRSSAVTMTDPDVIDAADLAAAKAAGITEGTTAEKARIRALLGL